MRIAVASLRGVKVEAAREAVAMIKSDLGVAESDVEYLWREVKPDVPETPLSRHQLMRGAKSRAEKLAALVEADYYIGLEGGLDLVEFDGERRVFLQSWAYVSDGQAGYFGASGAMELPGPLARAVLDEGIELGVAIDRYAGEEDVRSRQGSFGVLTKNHITRRQSFVLALLAAFAPFYNRRLYSEELGEGARS